MARNWTKNCLRSHPAVMILFLILMILPADAHPLRRAERSTTQEIPTTETAAKTKRTQFTFAPNLIGATVLPTLLGVEDVNSLLQMAAITVFLLIAFLSFCIIVYAIERDRSKTIRLLRWQRQYQAMKALYKQDRAQEIKKDVEGRTTNLQEWDKEYEPPTRLPIYGDTASEDDNKRIE